MAAGLWAAPELIPAVPATTDEGRPLSPLNAPGLDAEGDAFITWAEPTVTSGVVAPEFRVRATVRPADGRWQPAETLSPGLNPEVAVDARGEEFAVWEGRSGVEAAVKPVDGGWLAPRTVGSRSVEEPQEPQVASDASGDAIAVGPLRASGRNSTGIEAAERHAGGSFSLPQRISRRPEAAHDPRIAMNSDGDAIVIWDAEEGSGCVLRAAFRPAGGAWGDPQTVPGGHEFCRGHHSVAIDQRGQAIAAWVTMRGSTMRVETASRSVEGRWSTRRTLGTASAAAEPPEIPQVGMDAHGDATVLWIDPAHVLGGRRAMFARTLHVRHGWGARERIAEVAYESAPSFAMNARGDASVVWEDNRGIEAASRAWGGGWQEPQTLADPSSADIALEAVPVVALGAGGDGMIAWQGQADLETAWHAPLSP